MHYTGFNLGLKFPGVSYVHKQKIPTLENQDRFMVLESKIKSWELFLCPVRNSIIGLEEIDKSFQFPKGLQIFIFKSKLTRMKNSKAKNWVVLLSNNCFIFSTIH